ncbi:MAG TPA: prepilin-type N-terminal cleavage/methylation domain-containing protein [Terriglobales bacterium]|jgi:prepilin-type N-terminal cleavage/methylation domain-containing protein|nr:prepilin-type N-terminal cleavage/methylation domain-containing protein [Terriglobales bacterium]
MKKHKAKKNKGFSLIELLIVVAIILIIAAIAIPNLLRSRIAANEASAVGSLRTLNTAEVTYNSTYPNVGFACSLGQLGPSSGSTVSSATAGLIDANLAGGNKSGYTFSVLACSGSPATAYDFKADPTTAGVTGQRYFCTDSSGVIQYNSATFTDNGGVCSTGSPI